jgi:hypothetical protein
MWWHDDERSCVSSVGDTETRTIWNGNRFNVRIQKQLCNVAKIVSPQTRTCLCVWNTTKVCTFTYACCCSDTWIRRRMLEGTAIVLECRVAPPPPTVHSIFTYVSMKNSTCNSYCSKCTKLFLAFHTYGWFILLTIVLSHSVILQRFSYTIIFKRSIFVHCYLPLFHCLVPAHWKHIPPFPSCHLSIFTVHFSYSYLKRVAP